MMADEDGRKICPLMGWEGIFQRCVQERCALWVECGNEYNDLTYGECGLINALRR